MYGAASVKHCSSPMNHQLLFCHQLHVNLYTNNYFNWAQSAAGLSSTHMVGEIRMLNVCLAREWFVKCVSACTSIIIVSFIHCGLVLACLSRQPGRRKACVCMLA